MGESLLQLKTDELLQKFGAGNHKPGSGSAAAIQGIVSAHLLRTVIELTNEPKRQKKYAEWLPDMMKILSEVNARILPRLEELFQSDSEQFDKTIKKRKERNKEEDIERKVTLANDALTELKFATEIPIEIANLCVELADFSKYVFANGFKSARGDAGVAQNGAIAAVGGCLSIIYLNLLSFRRNKWTDEIFTSISLLEKNYRRLINDSITSLETIKDEAEKDFLCQSEFDLLIKNIPDQSRLNDKEIEKIATDVQNLLWKHKEIIWKGEKIDHPLDYLDK